MDNLIICMAAWSLAPAQLSLVEMVSGSATIKQRASTLALKSRLPTMRATGEVRGFGLREREMILADGIVKTRLSFFLKKFAQDQIHSRDEVAT